MECYKAKEGEGSDDREEMKGREEKRRTKRSEGCEINKRKKER